MQRMPIKSSVPTLRPGDVITNLACRDCTDKQILVLDRNATDSAFDFSMRGHVLSIVKDTNGPFRWDKDMNTFIDKTGRAYNHINRNSVVVQGAGMTELAWYQSLPKQDQVPFLVNAEGLGNSLDRALVAKLMALTAGSLNKKRASGVTDNMQQAITLALGDTEISEVQMRALLAVVSLYLGEAISTMESRFADGMMGTILSELFGGSMNDVMFAEMSTFAGRSAPRYARA